ncbi:MAG: transporter substrate-binding domain-containing protein [Clostridia bacterium]|nr:transporter substrate-binding domain-containing protein [Clostridia bacterium]
MKKMTKIIAAVMALVLLVSITACGKSGLTLEDIKADGKLIVATNSEFPPFEYKDGDAVVGFDMDLCAYIAKEIGVTMEVLDIAFEDVIANIQSGSAHIGAAGMTVKPDRLQNVDFSDTYFKASQVIILKEDAAFTATSELKNMNIGVQDGTTGADYVRENIKEPMGFASGALAIEAMKAGQIDCVIIDNYPAIEFVKKNPGLKVYETPLTVEEYAIAIPKNSPELVEVINKVIKDLTANGEFDKLLEKYELK